MFSSRVPAHLEPNSLSRALVHARSAGRALIDLTLTNPTSAGIVYPPGLFRALSKHEVARYSPDPLGAPCAREAVARDYARRGLPVAWERIALTSSTSEAYSLLFKLLCSPCGDSVLVPVPSYPLFEHLTGLDGVTSLPYSLQYHRHHRRWWVDFDSVEDRWGPATRAVLAVSPNNPTGSVLDTSELAALDALCAARDAALVIDEVFADYALDDSVPRISNIGSRTPPDALTFRLGGLSKSAALPQVKLGWIAVDGPKRLVQQAIERLEVICDTYLSVSTPVQVAAGDLLAGGAEPRRQITERIRHNYSHLRELVTAHPAVEVLEAEAGWSAVLRIPSLGSEEALVLDLVERAGVVAHPGFFFDFPEESYLIVSLLPDPGTFADGVRRVLERVDG